MTVRVLEIDFCSRGVSWIEVDKIVERANHSQAITEELVHLWFIFETYLGGRRTSYRRDQFEVPAGTGTRSGAKGYAGIGAVIASASPR